MDMNYFALIVLRALIIISGILLAKVLGVYDDFMGAALLLGVLEIAKRLVIL